LYIILWTSNVGVYDETWSQEECDWPAIACVEQAISGTSISDSSSSMNVVTEINGPNSDWIGLGSISPDLALLTSLTLFDLSSKDLTGTLPWSMGQWINLITFNVHHNALTGPLPTSIGDWTNLQRFSVYDNALTGMIPTAIAQWSGIQTVLLDTNQFTGTVPNGICQFRSVDLTLLHADCNVECQCCTYCK
jgi:Leucine-rich repeat (LRR) protein